LQREHSTAAPLPPPQVVSILTNISAPYVKDFFNDQRKVIKPELAALFGIVYQEPPASLQYGAIAPPSNGLTPQLCHGLRDTCSYYLNTSATDCFGLRNVVDAGVAPFYLLAHIFDNTAGAFDVDAMLPIVNKLPKSGKPYTRVDLEAMTPYKLLVTQFDDRHKCGKAIAGTLKVPRPASLPPFALPLSIPLRAQPPATKPLSGPKGARQPVLRDQERPEGRRPHGGRARSA
jgi:hypothetical protein